MMTAVQNSKDDSVELREEMEEVISMKILERVIDDIPVAHVPLQHRDGLTQCQGLLSGLAK